MTKLKVNIDTTSCKYENDYVNNVSVKLHEIV